MKNWAPHKARRMEKKIVFKRFLYTHSARTQILPVYAFEKTGKHREARNRKSHDNLISCVIKAKLGNQ